MTFLLRLLFSPILLGPVARLVAALLRPGFRTLGLAPATIGPVLDHAGAALTGEALEPLVIPDWTPEEVAELVASVASALSAIPAAFGVVVSTLEVGRLVRAIAGHFA